METIDEMRERHKAEIKELQRTCKHPEVSGWIREWWAIGHSTGFEVKVCGICGKIVARRTKCAKCGKVTEDCLEGTGTPTRPFGSYYCKKCYKRSEEEVAIDEKEVVIFRGRLKRGGKNGLCL